MLIALYVIKHLISLYALVMLIYCLASWFIRDPGNPFMRALAVITEPPLRPIQHFLRRFYYFQNSPIDFSPLILFLFLRILTSALEWLAGYLV